MAGAEDWYILDPVSLLLCLCWHPRLSPHVEAHPPIAMYAAYDIMSHPRFSASAESLLSPVSSPPSASEDCECLECERIYHIARRPSFIRYSSPSLTKLQIPTMSLHNALPSPITLQKQKAQMASMGYSKLFNLGYFSVTGALQSSG